MKNYLLATGSGVAAKVAVAVVNLSQVPLALHYLSLEAFGLWMALVSAVQMLNFADLGTGLSLQNEISKAYSNANIPLIADYYATGRRILGLFGLLLLATLLPLCWIIDWAGAFNVSDPILAAKVPTALAILLTVLCLSLPIGSASRVATGAQLGWLVNICTICGAVASLIAVLLVIHYELGFELFIVAAVTPQAIAGVGVHLGLCFGRMSLSSSVPGVYRRDLVPRLLGNGLEFLVPQLAGVVINSSPSIMIASQLGPAALTPYAVTQKIVFSFIQFQQLPVSNLWPVYAEAHARGDTSWLKKYFMRSVIYSTVTATVFAVSIFFLGGRAIQYWTQKPTSQPSEALLAAFSLWTLAMCFMAPIVILLNACGRTRAQALGSIGSALLLLAIGTHFIQEFGVSGAVYAALVSSVCVVWPILLVEHRRMFRGTNIVL